MDTDRIDDPCPLWNSVALAFFSSSLLLHWRPEAKLGTPRQKGFACLYIPPGLGVVDTTGRFCCDSVLGFSGHEHLDPFSDAFEEGSCVRSLWDCGDGGGGGGRGGAPYREYTLDRARQD